ncbi:hypothetical protein RRF57_011694 [Xylaria bambusicola]|uniref:Uncharacterized protein n=1 Tax=Xylaria bambusicola TaxID=326684 RepID=A0AAN7UU46_9PEZI
MGTATKGVVIKGPIRAMRFALATASSASVRVDPAAVFVLEGNAGGVGLLLARYLRPSPSSSEASSLGLSL